VIFYGDPDGVDKSIMFSLDAEGGSIAQLYDQGRFCLLAVSRSVVGPKTCQKHAAS
jgi:hypothetical protein